jgi:hypothetical protein
MAEEGKKTSKIPFIFYLLLLFAGAFIYIYWRFSYYSLNFLDLSSWYDPGLYSVVILLVGFGLIGIFLYSQREEK